MEDSICQVLNAESLDVIHLLLTVENMGRVALAHAHLVQQNSPQLISILLIVLLVIFWPPRASSWRDRCHSLPPLHVVNDIVRNRCHYVAKGHKLGNLKDREWMISLSGRMQSCILNDSHTILNLWFVEIFLKGNNLQWIKK